MAPTFEKPRPTSQGQFPGMEEEVDPAQLERDEKGAIVASEKAKEIGSKVHAQAVQVEPEITKNLAFLVGDDNPAEYEPDKIPERGELYGFQHRLKTEPKVQQKIEREIADGKAKTREAAARELEDTIRFTVHYDEDDYGGQTQRTIDALRAREEVAGVQVKNRYAAPKEGNPYRGVHAIVTREDGLRYEVQFHTPRTQQVKDTMHSLYEEARVLPKGSPERVKLESEMADLSGDVINNPPAGATEVLTMQLADDTAEPGGYEFWAYEIAGGDGDLLYARTEVGPSTGVETLVDGQWVDSEISWEEIQSSPTWELLDEDPS